MNQLYPIIRRARRPFLATEQETVKPETPKTEMVKTESVNAVTVEAAKPVKARGKNAAPESNQ